MQNIHNPSDFIRYSVGSPFFLLSKLCEIEIFGLLKLRILSASEHRGTVGIRPNHFFASYLNPIPTNRRKYAHQSIEMSQPIFKHFRWAWTLEFWARAGMHFLKLTQVVSYTIFAGWVFKQGRRNRGGRGTDRLPQILAEIYTKPAPYI